jgi:putative ABC transport system permease protein
MLGKNPGFTAVAVLTLTIGIGATTAIFSVVDAVLLRPLPYREPTHLVSLYEDRTRDGFPRKEFTPANYADCKTQTQVFADISAGLEDFFNLSNPGGDPEMKGNRVCGRSMVIRCTHHGYDTNMYSSVQVYLQRRRAAIGRK